ncbi:carboxylesterase 5A-like [Polypterus senegalus]|uniref:carboxylesterase 5A-like n=1 Tax=Polypterus senegalus TaxID=55291 RepID=UPI00196589BA|nr:carboxylesterase 5A-like [Polypterus senegalus]
MGATTQFFIFISFIIWIGLASQLTEDDHANPVVSVENGRLKGSVSRVKGTERLVHEYLGIPFAKPPLGSLRLSAPEPPEPWTGVRDATRHPAICIQNVDFIEKFLEEVKLTLQIPVVSEDCLYLNIYTPAESNKESRLPVMVWIHGGGLMMGAATIYDGSALAAYENVVVVVIQYRLGILGFLSTGDDHCRGNWGLLDQIAALQWVQRNIKTFGGDPDSVTIFGESAGGCSVSALVCTYIILTICDIAFFPPGWQEGIEKDVAVSLLNKIFPAGIKNENEYIFNEYVGNITDPTLVRDLLTQISGDILMVKPTIIAANAHRDAGSPVYLYEFQHRPTLYGDTRPSFVKSDHVDDIGFVFGSCFWNGHIKLLGNLTEEENQLCRTIMAYWANFARNGNPNGDGLESWPLYNDGEQYMALNLKQSSGRGLKKEKMTFLMEKLPELMKEHSKNTEVHMDL